MITALLLTHSAIRYLVLLAGLATFAYAVFGWLTRRPYDRGMRITGASFAGLLHLQVLLGFVILVSGRFYMALIGHIFMMLAAAALAQLPLSVMRRRPPGERTFLPHVVCTLAAFLLVWGGVLAIQRGLLEAVYI